MNASRTHVWTAGAVLLGLALGGRPAQAAVYVGNPSTYQSLLGQLVPGDTLRLDAGRYLRLTIDAMQGTPTQRITITGPETGPAAIIEGEPCCNTVQLYGSSYIAIRYLTIDGRGYDVDGVNAKSASSHHILIEHCTFINLGNNQQTVGISTKSTAWNWTIRHNRITEAGTGIYLGGSSGDTPFVAGVIENNLIENTTGYCMQIKHQLPYSLLPGMPEGPSRTIIRNNVFIKDDRASPDGSRPNLLVGSFPDTGPGSTDLYEIYGNVLYHNSRESLLQATGRVSVHDNIFIDADPAGSALYLTDHYGTLQVAHVYNNTFYRGFRSVTFSTAPRAEGIATGNLMLTDTPLGLCGSCSGVELSHNVADVPANAAQYVTQPSTVWGSMDFYPTSVCTSCTGTAVDLARFSGQTDFNMDFNGTDKVTGAFRGAYAGSGSNPGWRLTDSFKVGGPSSGEPPSTDTVPPSAPQDLRPR